MAQAYENLSIAYMNNESGETVPLEHDEVTCMIFRALQAGGNVDRLLALNLADKVIYRLINWKGTDNPFTLSEVEYMIRFVLIESGQSEASKYIGKAQKPVPQFN